MITYFATPRSRNELDVLCEEGATHILIPYNDPSIDLLYNHAISKGMTIMVDSGAFNAYTQGKVIDVKVFGKKMLELNPYQFINLDVIGDMGKTNKNQEYLESIGLKPIPVWHHGSGYESLGELVKKYEYIAIGGLVTSALTSTQRKNVILTITEMFPNTKFHGLGVGSEGWVGLYSGDSTTWLVGAKYGRLITKKGSVDLSGSYFTKKELIRHNIRAILALAEPISAATEMDMWLKS